MGNKFEQYFEGATNFRFPTVAEWRQAAGVGEGPYANIFAKLLEQKIQQHYRSFPPVLRGATLYLRRRQNDCEFVVTLKQVISGCNMVLDDGVTNGLLKKAAEDLKQLCGYQLINAQVPTAPRPPDSDLRKNVKKKTAHNLAKFAQVHLTSSPAVDAKFFPASAAPAASSSKAAEKMRAAASSSKRYPTKPTDGPYWSEMHAGKGDKRDAATTDCLGFKAWATPPSDPWWNTPDGRMASSCLGEIGGAPSKNMTFAEYMSYCGDMARNEGKIQYINRNELGSFLAIYHPKKQRWYQETGSGRMVLLDTRGQSALYAMSEDGLLFVDGQEGLPLNHVSFLRGRPVVCAGNAVFNSGQLLYIDNGSGHYKPGTEHLRRAIDVLCHNTNGAVMHSKLMVHDLVLKRKMAVSVFYNNLAWTKGGGGKK